MSHLSRRYSRKDSVIEICEDDMKKISLKMEKISCGDTLHEAEALDAWVYCLRDELYFGLGIRGGGTL